MSFIRRTFGGLSAAYYIRHFLIGLIFYIFIMFDFGGSKENPNYWSIMMTFTVCQLLYPYAYFVCCADFCRDSVLVWRPNHRAAWFGLVVLGTWQAGAMNRILRIRYGGSLKAVSGCFCFRRRGSCCGLDCYSRYFDFQVALT